MRQGLRALVVDDNEISLIVAQEILRELSIEAELAESGAKAVELCGLRSFDIILMDHIMPEMDGLEATKRIRVITNTPVVAMTANDDSGAADFYLSKGFAGFIKKPIDIKKLSNIVNKLVPQKGSAKNAASKKNKAPVCGMSLIYEAAEEAGLDVKSSVKKLGGNEKAYQTVLRLFTNNGPEKLKLLDETYAGKDWENFRITIHGQKSALANIGAASLSEEARTIEMAVTKGDIQIVDSVFVNFRIRFIGLIKILQALWSEDEEGERSEASEEDRAMMEKALRQAESDLEDLDQEKALEALAPLNNIRYGEPIDSGLSALRNAVDTYDYDKAAEMIKQLLKGAAQ
jgi:CheY-like chemotaxis protein